MKGVVIPLSRPPKAVCRAISVVCFGSADNDVIEQ